MSTHPAHHTSRHKLLAFLSGGAIATVVHWLVMLMIVQADGHPLVATATGATIGLIVNYVAQYRFTFNSSLSHRIAFSRYLSAASFGWGLNLLVFYAVHSLIGIALLSQAAATTATTMMNFVLANKFVFREEISHD